MKNQYSIAELTVKMEPQRSPLKERAFAYKSQENRSADLSISLTEEMYRYYEERFPGTERGLIEYMLTGNFFYSALLEHRGLLLHASAVALDGKAYLFSAPSGTGKSTHTALWVKEFAPRAHIINDDKPAIRFQDDGIFVYGTPWSGKTDQNLNIKVPLQGIAFLKRGVENKIEKASSSDAIRCLLTQTIRPKEKSKAVLLLEHIDALVKRVPIYQLTCNMQSQAACVAYETMKKGEVK